MQLIKNGVGDLVPGSFVVPQNPLLPAGAGLGNIVGPASFTVPQNPLLGNTVMSKPIQLLGKGKNALSSSLKGLGCGTCQSPSLSGTGMGSLDPTGLFNGTETFGAYFTDSTALTIPNWAMIVGIPLLLLEVFKRHKR